MKGITVLLVLLAAISQPTLAASPKQEAAALLKWLEGTSRQVDAAVKGGNKAELAKLQQEAARRFQSWPNDQAHSNYASCGTGAADLLSALQAQQRNDVTWFTKKRAQVREDIAGCTTEIAG